MGWLKRLRKNSKRAINYSAFPESQKPTRAKKNEAAVVSRLFGLTVFHLVSLIDQKGASFWPKKGIHHHIRSSNFYLVSISNPRLDATPEERVHTTNNSSARNGMTTCS